MSKPKSLKDCKKDTEFLAYAERQGAKVTPGGRHFKIATSKGTTVCSCHNHELPTGTRHALIKQLIAIGIVLLIGFAVLEIVKYC